MKNPLILIPLLLIALGAPCLAEPAPNPFLKKADAQKPEPPAGASFASLLEHVLVPPDLLDDWLREHPMKEDATALRAAVQGWVIEGKAMLDHTAFSLGTAGRKVSNDVILEKMYPTEFEPGGLGVWPMPTAFDARNLGHDMETGVTSAEGVPALWLKGESVEMVSSDSWVQLVESTRQPNDVFLPKILSKRTTQKDPSQPGISNDPFAEPAAPSGKVDYTLPRGLVFKPDIIQLASRFDPVSEENPSDNLSRLTFYRGSIATPPPAKPVNHSDITRLSFRTLRVSLPTFSTWLQNRSPLAVATEAWDAAEGWRKQGQARNIGEVSTRVRFGIQSTIENIEEFIYPTEWEPMDETEVMEKWEEGKKVNGKEGVASMRRTKITPIPGEDAAALPTAFDTRNIGMSMEATLSNDDQGLVLSYSWDRVVHLDDFVYHRIPVAGEWIPNVKMPLFAASRLNASVRLQPGQWTLLGGLSEYLKTEKLDRDQCLLVFVRAE